MARDLLDSNVKELSDLELKILSCSKSKPELRYESWLIGDVRQCAGFEPEARYTEISPGGVCQRDDRESEKICKGISNFLPTLDDTDYIVIKRDFIGGYGIISKKKDDEGNIKHDEVIIKKANNGWQPILFSPTGKLKDAVSENIRQKINNRYGNSFNDMLEFANGNRNLSTRNTTTFHEDEFGKALHNINTYGLISINNCHENQKCINMSENGYVVYYAHNRGKPNDGIWRNDKIVHDAVKGGVSMDFKGYLTGLEKTSDGQRKILLDKEVAESAKRKMTSSLNINNRIFSVDETGKIHTKNKGNPLGKKVKDVIDEMIEYEDSFATLGYTRPESSIIKIKNTPRPSVSGKVHFTFIPPASNFDRSRHKMWELFLLNFARLSQWWEPMVIGATGSPVKNEGRPIQFHSYLHHTDKSVKAGSSSVKNLVSNDGAIGIITKGDTLWTRNDSEFGGIETTRNEKDGDLATVGGIKFTIADSSDCKERVSSSDHDMCDTLTDRGIQLRYFEYEPLHLLEERAKFIPVLMDRAYQLSSQDIEVPEARDRRTWNDFMWRIMRKGSDAELSETMAKEFGKILLGKEDAFAGNIKVFDAGKQIVDDLWKKHYDDYFTNYFGVIHEPAHINYAEKNKEMIEMMESEDEQYEEVDDVDNYGNGSLQ